MGIIVRKMNSNGNSTQGHLPLMTNIDLVFLVL